MASYTFTVDERKLKKILASDSFTKQGYDMAIEDALDNIQEKTLNRYDSYANQYGLGGTQFISRRYVHRYDKYFEIGVNADEEIVEIVEYGTGIVGENSPHPEGGNYDLQGHGYKGWFFGYNQLNMGNVSGDEFKNVGRGFYTRGQKSRPVNYLTFVYLRLIATRMTNNSIRRMINAS